MNAFGARAGEPPGGTGASRDVPGTAPGGPVGAAWNALTGVFDPELYLDLVSLGLVYDVRHQDGVIVVEMTLTTPGCPVSESLPDMAKAAVQEAVGDAATVDVRVVWDPPWNPDMMDGAAAAALGFRS